MGTGPCPADPAGTSAVQPAQSEQQAALYTQLQVPLGGARAPEEPNPPPSLTVTALAAGSPAPCQGHFPCMSPFYLHSEDHH